MRNWIMYLQVGVTVVALTLTVVQSRAAKKQIKLNNQINQQNNQ